MKELKTSLSKIPLGIMQEIDYRLSEFSSFKEKNEEDWFSELCFCILTANSRAKTAINIQNELGFNGFYNHNKTALTKTIKKNKHRFHNNKALYITEARKHFGIKSKLKKFNSETEARNFIAENVKGIGYKEASHFLRNVGYTNVAILDRHILNLMHENNIITKPKTLNKKTYHEIENKFNKLSKSLSLTPAKLDLMMWYLKTGEVLK